MTNDPFDLDAATRISRVDPEAGLGKRARPADRDATIIGALRPHPESRRRLTAEIVPSVGARSTAEVTAVWSGGKDGDRRAPFRPVADLLRRLPRGRRALRVGALACAVSIAAALVASFASRAPAPTAFAPGRAAPTEFADAGPEPTAPEPAPSALALPGEPVRLSHLVDALGEGRLDDARSACAALLLAAPGDRALRAALEILDRAQGGRAP